MDQEGNATVISQYFLVITNAVWQTSLFSGSGINLVAFYSRSRKPGKHTGRGYLTFYLAFIRQPDQKAIKTPSIAASLWLQIYGAK